MCSKTGRWEGLRTKLGESLYNCFPPLVQHEDGGGDSSSDMEDEYCPSSGEDEGQEESDSDEDYTSLSEGGSESGKLVVLSQTKLFNGISTPMER